MPTYLVKISAKEPMHSFLLESTLFTALVRYELIIWVRIKKETAEDTETEVKIKTHYNIITIYYIQLIAFYYSVVNYIHDIQIIPLYITIN